MERRDVKERRLHMGFIVDGLRSWLVKKLDKNRGPATVVVAPGDSLWKIAEELTGSGTKWPDIAALNPQVRGPDYVIQPGQTLKVPADWFSA